MSGGSLDYAHSKIWNVAELIRSRPRTTALHRAFAKHLEACAEAAHALELVYSDDASEGSEIPAIRAVLPKNAALQQLIDEAHEVMKQLREELEKACAGARK